MKYKLNIMEIVYLELGSLNLVSNLRPTCWDYLPKLIPVALEFLHLSSRDNFHVIVFSFINWISLITFLNFYVPQCEHFLTGDISSTCHSVVERINEIKQVNSWHSTWERTNVESMPLCLFITYYTHQCFVKIKCSL